MSDITNGLRNGQEWAFLQRSVQQNCLKEGIHDSKSYRHLKKEQKCEHRDRLDYLLYLGLSVCQVVFKSERFFKVSNYNIFIKNDYYKFVLSNKRFPFLIESKWLLALPACMGFISRMRKRLLTDCCDGCAVL